jgi:hypothetical protein
MNEYSSRMAKANFVRHLLSQRIGFQGRAIRQTTLNPVFFVLPIRAAGLQPSSLRQLLVTNPINFHQSFAMRHVLPFLKMSIS